MIYKGYYYKGRIFPGQSALPLMLDAIEDYGFGPYPNERSLPYNIKMEPPFDKEPLFPNKDGGVIEYTENKIGWCWNDRGQKEDFIIASPVFPFGRIK